MGLWPHRGAQDGYLIEVTYPKTRIRELETGADSLTRQGQGPAILLINSICILDKDPDGWPVSLTTDICRPQFLNVLFLLP